MTTDTKRTRKVDEGFHKFPYVENGCSHHSDCFTCPFEDCIAGNRNVGTFNSKEPKATPDQVMALRAKGYTALQISTELEISYRTVFRLQALAKPDIIIVEEASEMPKEVLDYVGKRGTFGNA